MTDAARTVAARGGKKPIRLRAARPTRERLLTAQWMPSAPAYRAPDCQCRRLALPDDSVITGVFRFSDRDALPRQGRSTGIGRASMLPSRARSIDSARFSAWALLAWSASRVLADAGPRTSRSMAS